MGWEGGGQHPTGSRAVRGGCGQRGNKRRGAAAGTLLLATRHTGRRAPCAAGRARRGGGHGAASRQYVKQKDISFYLPAAAPGHNPPTFNLYSTTHVSFPASDYFLSSNYRGDKME